MTISLSHARPGTCQAADVCSHPPCFQARLEAAGRSQTHRVRKEADACAGHLGNMVQALTAWARAHGLTDGELTVLAVDPPPAGIPPALRAIQEEPDSHALAFSTMRL